ncbi:MAG: IS110 family transposase [Candidatus Heimdallarchaeota archaeon]|nr:IS110 family transposase [Candidatus Heimdallarchaeota archaeon]
MKLQQDKDLASMYVGIDISKKNIDVCQMYVDGKVMNKFRITSDLVGFKQLIKSIPKNEDPLFAMESTGPFSGNLENYLKSKGYKLCNGFELSRLREAFAYKIKNDDMDAWVLAQAARLNVLKHSSTESEYTYLRDVLERYYDLKDRKTSIVNQLHANLVVTFPEMDEMFYSIASNASIAILEHYQTAEQFLSASNTKIREIVLGNKGKMSISKIEKMKKLCKESVAWKTGRFAREIIKSQIREIQIIMKEIITHLNLLDEYVDLTFPKEIKLLRSVPGVGKITATYMLAVMGDPNRFDPDKDGNGAKRISSFVGFSVIEYSSGARKSKYGLNKRGNSKLRGLLYMAALSAIQQDHDIAKTYTRKRERSSGKKAIVSIGHLLLRRGYGVLKTGKMYNPAIPMAG